MVKHSLRNYPPGPSQMNNDLITKVSDLQKPGVRLDLTYARKEPGAGRTLTVCILQTLSPHARGLSSRPNSDLEQCEREATPVPCSFTAGAPAGDAHDTHVTPTHECQLTRGTAVGGVVKCAAFASAVMTNGLL